MEGLKELLEKVKEGTDIDDVLGQIIELHEDGISGLKRKNDELIGKVKRLKAGESSGDVDKLEEELAQYKDQAEKLTREKTRIERDYARKLEDLGGKLKSEAEFTSRLVVDRGLTDALIKAGIDEEHLPILREFHKSKVKLTDDREPLYTAADGEKPLADYLKTWAETEGKRYVKAPVHMGGPVIGKKGSFTGKDFSKMSLDEITAYAKTGPDQSAEVSEYLRNKKKGA